MSSLPTTPISDEYFNDTTFRSVFDWAERMPTANGDYDCDDFTHIKQWWGGRGSLWKPISNIDRISRQELRHRQMALRVSILSHSLLGSRI
eukprot:1936146-Pyramimonas_sp.AAC.1